MTRVAKMTDRELKAIVDAEITDALGYHSGDLSKQRQKAMEYYLGEPFGNEVEGRSSVVITEVADTIEWILPSLLKVFAGSDEVVRFDPVGHEDRRAADIETEAVNHAFYKDNTGFLILYTWFKDALLQKNGYVKCYWDESEKVTREEYNGLTEAELAQLLEDPELEPVEQEETQATAIKIDPMTGQPAQVVMSAYDVVFKRTRQLGKIQIDPMPPEEVLVSRKARSIFLNDVPFVAHRTKKTATELREMGIEQSVIDKLSAFDGDGEFKGERTARFNLDDEAPDLDRDGLDKSMREYWVTECYIKVDRDGDGLAELRKVTRAGHEILLNEEIDRVPMSCLTPVILTHKHVGQSVADLVMDLQLIKSTLTRQILDNIYNTNNQRTVVGPSVNLDDLLTSRPGGIVRANNVADVVPYPALPLPTQAYDMLNYMDQIKESRTGVSRMMQGMNQDISGDTAHGVERLMSAAEQKIELIARIFAETGVKDLFLQIHELLKKHGKPRAIPIKGDFLEVDPAEWRDRNDMSIKVGLGTGDRSRMQMALARILEFQEKIAMQGGQGTLVSPKNIYNALSDFTRYSGLNSVDPYFTDPDSPAAQQAANQPPPPDPNMEMLKLQAQIEQTKAQNEVLRIQMDFQAKMAETERRQREMEGAHKTKMAELDQRFIEKMTEFELKYHRNVPGAAV